MTDITEVVSQLRYGASLVNTSLAKVMLEAAERLETLTKREAVLAARNDSQQRQILDLAVPSTEPHHDDGTITRSDTHRPASNTDN